MELNVALNVRNQWNFYDCRWYFWSKVDGVNCNWNSDSPTATWVHSDANEKNGKKVKLKPNHKNCKGKKTRANGNVLPVVLVVLSNCSVGLAINSTDWYSYRTIRIWWKFFRCCFYWSVNCRMWWTTMMLRPNLADFGSSAYLVCWSLCWSSSSSLWRCWQLLLSLCCAVHKRK